MAGKACAATVVALLMTGCGAAPVALTVASHTAPATQPIVVPRIDPAGTARGGAGAELDLRGSDLAGVSSATVDRTRLACRPLPAGVRSTDSPQQIFLTLAKEAYAAYRQAARPGARRPSPLTTTGACVATPDRLLLLMPRHAPGTVSITVAGTVQRFTYTTAPVPVVQAITPHAGTAAGGDSFEVFGSGLTGVTGATLGGQPAQTVFPFDDQHAYVSGTPPGSAGTAVDVLVTTPGGTSAPNAAARYTYTAPPNPVIDRIDPSTAPNPGGSSVTIYGTGLMGATAVNFGSTAVTFFEGPNAQDTTVGVQPPAAASAGTVNVSVVVGGLTSNVLPFTYTQQVAPTISYFAPATAPAGATVFVFGSGFLGVTAVDFGAAASPSSFAQSDSVIEAEVPAGSGSVSLKVIGAAGQVTASSNFTYGSLPAGPRVYGLTAHQGSAAGGTDLTVLGSGFTNLVSVQFGSAQAWLAGFCAFTCDTEVVILGAPAGQAGTTVDVMATTTAGTSPANAGDRFTYVAPGVPAVYSVDPAQGLDTVAPTVTVNGVNLSGITSAHFGAMAATNWITGPPLFANDTHTTVYGPIQSPGTVDVTITTGGGTSAINAGDVYTYLPEPATAVTALGPDRGPAAGGTTMYVEGAGFTGATAVAFGSASAAGFTVVDDDLIQAVSPGGVGQVDVIVTTPRGSSSASAADLYTYLSPPLAPLNPNAVAGPYGSGTAGVTWSAPSFDGGSAITQYTVYCIPWCAPVVVPPSQLSATVTGLMGLYGFYVTATNRYGEGPRSVLTASLEIRGPVVQATPAAPAGRTPIEPAPTASPQPR